MLVKNINDIQSFLAGDKTILKEILHPANDKVQLPYSLAHAFLEPGTKSLWHKLDNTEVYLFLNGSGIISIEKEKHPVKAGSLVVVPPGANQYVENTGKDALTFICVVSPQWSPEKEEIFDVPPEL